MPVLKGDMLFHGLDDISGKLDSIIKTLNLKKQHFEIKLIISEAVSNAFIHGNNRDESKPISIKWELENHLLRIDVTDCGCGFKDIKLYKQLNEKKIFEDCGRGLYIISCYTDEVKFEGSSIIMKKYLS